jgi:hypothetical protein
VIQGAQHPGITKSEIFSAISERNAGFSPRALRAARWFRATGQGDIEGPHLCARLHAPVSEL